VSWLFLMLLRLSITSKAVSLAAATPIFLPIISCGELIGVSALLRMQNGDFCSSAPMILMGAPWARAVAMASALSMPTSALPPATTVAGLAFGPPGSQARSMPAAVKYPLLRASQVPANSVVGSQLSWKVIFSAALPALGEAAVSSPLEQAARRGEARLAAVAIPPILNRSRRL
jgi:hypothetical protein